MTLGEFFTRCGHSGMAHVALPGIQTCFAPTSGVLLSTESVCQSRLGLTHKAVFLRLGAR